MLDGGRFVYEAIDGVKTSSMNFSEQTEMRTWATQEYRLVDGFEFVDHTEAATFVDPGLAILVLEVSEWVTVESSFVKVIEPGE